MDVAGERLRFESVMRRVEALDQPDREALTEFYERCRKDGVGFARITSYMKQLLILRGKGFPLRGVTDNIILRVLEQIELEGYAESTISSFKAAIKKLYGTPWLKTTERRNKRRLPEGLVMEEEALAMAQACVSPRDRALIATLFDLGCRPSELLRLKVGDVKFDEYGAIIGLNGKTGPRRVRAVLSSPYLRGWLESYPRKDDSEAPFWPAGGRTRGGYVTVSTLQKIVQGSAERAGIKRRIYPYLFRHSRATSNAGFMTEAQLCAYHGWTQGSRMPGRYVHLSGRDVDDALLKHYNLKKEEERPKDSVRRCPRCREINQPRAGYCFKCGYPLAAKTFEEYKEKQSEALTRFQEFLVENPDVFEVLRAMREGPGK